MTTQATVRKLSPEDLDRAVTIDQAIVKRSRRGYFEKRLAAALREPEQHLQYGVDGEDGLDAILLCRTLTGEFGGKEPSVLLEIIDVADKARGQGLARQLLSSVEADMRKRGIGQLLTQAVWSDANLLTFFAANGFRKGRRHIIDCNVSAALAAERKAAEPELEDEPPAEPDYGADRADDYGSLAHDPIEIRTLQADDLADMVRIDRHVSGRDRHDYMRMKLDEALNDTAIRISQAAEIDDLLAGFLMARIDFGDFGRTEPVAILDTIDVGPEWAHHGVATALLLQLLVNLEALQVEHLETSVGRNDFELLRFLYHHGFEPSQRIALEKQVA